MGKQNIYWWWFRYKERLFGHFLFLIYGDVQKKWGKHITDFYYYSEIYIVSPWNEHYETNIMYLLATSIFTLDAQKYVKTATSKLAYFFWKAPGVYLGCKKIACLMNQSCWWFKDPTVRCVSLTKWCMLATVTSFRGRKQNNCRGSG